jgi:Mrp family chromosome partitioning ATPase
LKATEATTVVRHADAAILVVRQGVTTERQLGSAIAELNGTEIGVVINRSSTRVPKLLRRFIPPT